MLHQLTCETMGAAIIASHPFCSKVPEKCLVPPSAAAPAPPPPFAIAHSAFSPTAIGGGKCRSAIHPRHRSSLTG